MSEPVFQAGDRVFYEADHQGRQRWYDGVDETGPTRYYVKAKVITAPSPKDQTVWTIDRFGNASVWPQKGHRCYVDGQWQRPGFLRKIR